MENDKFIETFKQSLFDKNTEKISEDITKIGVNILLESNIIKEIPFVNLIVSVKNFVTDVYARHLLKNTLLFLKHLNDGSITEKEREKFLNRISKESSMEEEMERILLLLHRATELKKSLIYANLLKTLVKDKIDLSSYHELLEVTDRIFINDIEMLKFIYDEKEIHDKKHINYKVGRLESLGLVQNHLLMGNHNLLLYESAPEEAAKEKKLEKEGCFLTQLGERYIEIIYNMVLK